MTKLLSILAGIVLAGAWGGVMAQYASVPPSQQYRSDERRYGHLEYFGFYASAMGQWNFTEELAPYTNLTWIHVGSGNHPDAGIDLMIERLAQARAAGVEATLSIEPYLFENARGDLRPRSEIEDFLVALRARLEFEGLLDTVALIYPKDEPFREFIRYRNPSFYDQYVTGDVYEDIHRTLVEVNGLIKLAFPDKPIGVILSGYDVFHRFFSIPENYDWVGFDCYADLFEACDDRSFVDFYQRLLDYMQPQQRLIAVPETWVQNDFLNRADWPDVLLARLRHHYEMALNEPRFVAFIPFIWSFESANKTPGLGLDRFPDLFDDGVDNRGTAFVEAVLAIGAQVKSGAPTPPNLAWSQTENSPYRPADTYRGQIMSITPGGMVSAWAFSDALPHKNLRVRLVVRDSLGKVVYRSRPERTFIKDDSLGQPDDIGRRAPGLHGYRLRLPKDLLQRYRNRSVYVDLRVFADGEPLSIGYIHSVSYRPGEKLVSPPN